MCKSKKTIIKNGKIGNIAMALRAGQQGCVAYHTSIHFFTPFKYKKQNNTQQQQKYP
jgi:hypothetical protein